MITCGRCGTDNDENEIVCARCGTELDDGGARALIGHVVLGGYEITDVLGRGGMSVVYRGRHKMTEQRVALKILPPELAIHAALKTRFLEEAKALARLEHANIVRLYNFGEEAGRFVLAMEYVEGKTFEKMIMERGRVPWTVVARIGVEVCKALEYAHGRGVVHRDIKPSNVLVRPDGSATVMDFGIAKMTESSRLTATGQTMGTVRYMSPEQVRGQVVDLRTDIYSLGVALFEGLVGDTPFQGDTHFEIMSKHLSEPPPPLRAMVPDVPEVLEQVIVRSLGKAREDRYQSAAEMQQALEACLAGVTPLPAPPPGAPMPVMPRLDSAAPTTVAPRTPVAKAPPTGLASRLEPAIAGAPLDLSAPPPRRRTGLWVALAALLVVGAGGVVLFTQKQQGSEPVASPGAGLASGGAAATAAAPDAALAAPSAWPDALRPAGVTFVVDEKFDAPQQVRVLATRKLDAAHIARTYTLARSRFITFADAQQVGVPVEIHPLNLAIVPARVMCAPELTAPEPPGPRCADQAFYYEPRSRTLFVPDDDSAELVAIPEGAAVHLCRTTPVLHQRGCGATLLRPFFEEIERSL